MYVHGFRFYFTPLAGVLFAFPSRYWFTIGQSGVFSLGGWSPHIQTGCHVSRPTHRTHNKCIFVYGTITLYCATFQTLPLMHKLIQVLGSSPFARRYWGNLGCFLFLGVLRCFSSPGSPCMAMYSPCNSVSKHTGFPHSGIVGYNGSYHLTDAFRRLARPSSPLTA